MWTPIALNAAKMWPLPAIRSSGELQLLDSFVSSGRLPDEDLQLMYGGLSEYVHKVETWRVRNYHLHVGGLHHRRFKVRSAFKFKNRMYGLSMSPLSRVSLLYSFIEHFFSSSVTLCALLPRMTKSYFDAIEWVR